VIKIVIGAATVASGTCDAAIADRNQALSQTDRLRHLPRQLAARNSTGGGGEMDDELRERPHHARQVPLVIDILITAVRNGELDAQLAQPNKPATAPKSLKAA
jgi:hypothetical protein